MRGQTGFAIVPVLAVALICVPIVAPAGCPLMGGVNITCDSSSSSIETCVNAIWSNLGIAAALTRSLKTMPGDPTTRIGSLREARASFLPAIRLLGSANKYNDQNIGPFCDASWYGVERCETAIRSARRGEELLGKPELVAALSQATRERLKQSLRQHETEYSTQLDLIAASGQGDPSELCNTTYASEPSCERAVAADSEALRKQVFPDYSCGRVIPGKFVSAKDQAEDMRGPADGTGPQIILRKYSFKDAQDSTQSRLQEEIKLLAKTRQPR